MSKTGHNFEKALNVVVAKCGSRVVRCVGIEFTMSFVSSFLYILFVVDYVSKLVEAMAFMNNED